MATDIGSGPTDINLTTYSGSGVNNGTSKSLSSLQPDGKPILLAFINSYNQSGQAWMTRLAGIKDTTFSMYIVMFKYDGSSWSTPSEDFDVIPMVTVAGGDAAFDSIPIVIDNSGGTISNGYQTGLFSVPVVKKSWTYLIDEAYLISDKWHSESTAAGYPISFKHLNLDPDPGDFDGADPDIAGAYVLKRIENLIADITIIKAQPMGGAIIHGAADINRIIFSRHLDSTAAVNVLYYTLGGGGIQGGGPDNASTAAYNGTDKAENAVVLSFISALKDDPDNDVTVTVDTANIKDTSNGALSGENTITYFADVTNPGPILDYQVLITDGTGADIRTTRIETGGPAPCILNPDRTLNVRILSDNPGPGIPAATLDKPGGGQIALTFHGLIAGGLDQGDLNETGQYHLHINQYIDGNSTTLAPADFYFGIIGTAASFASHADALEGWGYFPREEGIPENCPEGSMTTGTHPDGGSPVPGWTGSGAGIISAGNGEPLKIAKDGVNTMDRTYARSYGNVLKNEATANDDWDAPAYIEASLKATVTTSSTTLTVIDATDPANPVSGIQVETTGAGIRLQNGPYLCELTLVNVTTPAASHTGTRLALRVHSNNPGARAYAFSDQIVNWTAFHTVKIQKAVDGGDRVFKVYTDNTAPAAAITIKEKNLPMVVYDDYPGDESVAFGVFEDVNQDVDAVFDFFRYAFFDAKYELGQNGNTLSLGFPNLHRSTIPPETNFFRSPDIMLDNVSNTDPVFQQNK